MNFGKRFSLLALSLILLSTSAPIFAVSDYDEDEDIIEQQDKPLSDNQKVWHGIKGVLWGTSAVILSPICLLTGMYSIAAFMGSAVLSSNIEAIRNPESEEGIRAATKIGLGLGAGLGAIAITSGTGIWFSFKWSFQALQKALREEKERRLKSKNWSNYKPIV